MGVGIRAIILILCSTVIWGRVQQQDISSISDVSIILNVPPCNTQSHGSNQWELSKSFIFTLLDKLNISSSWTRVAFTVVQSHGDKGIIIDCFTYSRYFNRECLVKGIRQRLQDEYDADQENSTIDINKFHSELKESKRMNAQQVLIVLKTEPSNANDIEMKLINMSDDVFLVNTNLSDQKIDKFNINKYYEMKSKGDVERIVNDLTNGAGSITSCTVGYESEIVYDGCRRECQCIEGRLANCTRVRNEFTAMTHDERRLYLKVYKTLTNDPLYKERYEHFVFMHFKYFCWGIHQIELFCPWHRWYLWQFENIMREIDCRVTIPYWDWSHAAWDPWNKTQIWTSNDYGLGGDGDKNKGYCVQTGIFREGEWRTPFYEDTLDIIESAIDQTDDNVTAVKPDLSYCLRRSFHGLPFPSKHIATALRTPLKKFADFELILRHTYHDVIHNLIGGTMSTHYAGETPEFWMHHSFLDKIWYEWQAKSENHKDVYFKELDNRKMLGCPFEQMEFIDSHDLPGCVHVRYTKFGKAFRSKRSIDEGYYGKEIDDEDRSPISYWDGIIEASRKDKFPNCKRSKREEMRSRRLSRRIFKMIKLPNWFDPNEK